MSRCRMLCLRMNRTHKKWYYAIIRPYHPRPALSPTATPRFWGDHPSHCRHRHTPTREHRHLDFRHIGQRHHQCHAGIGQWYRHWRRRVVDDAMGCNCGALRTLAMRLLRLFLQAPFTCHSIDFRKFSFLWPIEISTRGDTNL